MPMFNPQQMMGGMGMGQLPNFPSVKELWKNEKSKYRHWMIMFGVGIAVVFALLLVSVILNATSTVAVKDAMAKNAWVASTSIPYPGSLAQARIDILSSPGKDITALVDAINGIDKAFTWRYVAIPAVQVALVGIGMLLYFSTLAQSYQAKSFHKLSGWGTMVIGIGVFISIYQLFSLIWSGQAGSFNSTGGLFQFITYFVIIGVYFSGSMQVSKIRRMFAQSFRIEQIKASPEYQQAMQQMNAMQNGQMPNGFANGPFGPTMGTPTGNPTATGTAPGASAAPDAQTTAAPAKSSERLDLESMSVTDLKKVASKLDISGSSAMKKKELVEAILRVTENK